MVTTHKRKAPKRRTLMFSERKFIAAAIREFVHTYRATPTGDINDSDNEVRAHMKLKLAQDIAMGNVILETRP